MKHITFRESSNPDGLIQLVNALPYEFTDPEYRIVFPGGFLYSGPFPIIAAWSKRATDETRLTLDLSACQESARRLVQNVGLTDIVEHDMEAPARIFKGPANVPLQPIVVGRSTEQVLDRVYHMVDDWTGYMRDTSAFKTILSELAENILVHSEACAPGYVHARVHHSQQGEKCEITFADCGIGILHSYLEGTNETVKTRLNAGATALQIAIDGLNSSKPKEASPGGRSHFGYGLFTVKRLIELNRGRMTIISGNEYITLDRYKTNCGHLQNPWQGTIVALVIDLANPLPLEDVYEEEVARIVPAQLQSTPQPFHATPMAEALLKAQESKPSEVLAVPSVLAEKRVLTVREFSTKLLARESALAIRAELATLLVDGAVVEVDLDGVEDITPSVADECFGKLAVRMGGAKFRTRVVFRGGVPLMHRLLDFVIANRLKAQQATGVDASEVGASSMALS